jgi:hypothetical protein
VPTAPPTAWRLRFSLPGSPHARAARPFAPALSQSDYVIYLEAGDEKTVLACFEEGLRHGGLGAVVAEVAHLPMTASRRLQLAAEGFGLDRHRPAALAASNRSRRLRATHSRHDALAHFSAASAARAG